MQRADSHKEAGNVLFSQEDYDGAIKEYTKAIIKDSNNQAYFTNRALCRLRLKRYEEALTDCQKAIELAPDSMKAFFYKGQSLLALDRPNEALSACKTAYQLALKQKSPSASNISAIVLEAKKRRWELLEERRIENEGSLLLEMRDLLNTTRRQKLEKIKSQLDGMELDEEVEIIDYLYDEKISQLEQTFARSSDKFRKRVGVHLIKRVWVIRTNNIG